MRFSLAFSGSVTKLMRSICTLLNCKFTSAYKIKETAYRCRACHTHFNTRGNEVKM